MQVGEEFERLAREDEEAIDLARGALLIAAEEYPKLDIAAYEGRLEALGVTLERRLSAQNSELRAAGERMRRDLDAAARVQRAMLPKKNIEVGPVRTGFVYVPTDELCGDGVGFHLVGDRYLIAYIVDVMGHGVPAALLSVTAMHALSPATGGSLLAGDSAPDSTTAPSPGHMLTALNRRFCAGDTDQRFLTMVLCVLDLADGRLRFARAG